MNHNDQSICMHAWHGVCISDFPRTYAKVVVVQVAAWMDILWGTGILSGFAPPPVHVQVVMPMLLLLCETNSSHWFKIYRIQGQLGNSG